MLRWFRHSQLLRGSQPTNLQITRLLRTRKPIKSMEAEARARRPPSPNSEPLSSPLSEGVVNTKKPIAADVKQKVKTTLDKPIINQTVDTTNTISSTEKIQPKQKPSRSGSVKPSTEPKEEPKSFLELAEEEERKREEEQRKPDANPLGWKIAVIGRPNVGKSTMFNRLIGRRLAIVDKSAGVTRDRKEALGTLGTLEFTIVDTAGLETVQKFLTRADSSRVTSETAGERDSRGKRLSSSNNTVIDQQTARRDARRREVLGIVDDEASLVYSQSPSTELQSNILLQTETAVAEADVILFLVDGRAGITPMDEHFAFWLRKHLHNKAKRQAEKENAEKQQPGEAKNSPTAGTAPENSAHKPTDLPEDMISKFAGLANKEEYLKIAKRKFPVLVCVNKCETERSEAFENANEAYGLGFGDPICISAQHGDGMGDLHNEILSLFASLLPNKIKEYERRKREDEEEEAAWLKEQEREQSRKNKGDKKGGGGGSEDDNKGQKKKKLEKTKLAFTILGKPNVGKSTMINALIGESRVVVGAQPGVTRDSVSIEWKTPKHPGYRFNLVDTAGLKGVTRAKHSQYSHVDSLAMQDSLRAMGMSNVVALLVDASLANDKQRVLPVLSQNPTVDDISMMITFAKQVLSATDLEIGRRSALEGKPVMILLNKIDVVPPTKRPAFLRGLRELLSSSLPQLEGITILATSGVSGEGLSQIMPTVVKLHKQWSMRLSTGLFNRWLKEATKFKAHQTVGGKPVKIKYGTQVSTRPPTFALFASRPEKVAPEYVKWLIASMRKEFDLAGIPIRMHVKASSNPFMSKGRRGGGHVYPRYNSSKGKPMASKEKEAELASR